MKIQTKFLMAVWVLAMAGCSTTGAIDEAMDANAKAKKADYTVMEAEYKKWRKGEGKLSVEAARQFVLPNWLRENEMDVHFSRDRFTTELFAYVLAERMDEIDWTPERIALLRSRTESCDRAKGRATEAFIERQANARTPTIDPRTGMAIVQGELKYRQAVATWQGSCNGVDVLGAAYAAAAAAGKKDAPKNKLEIE